MALDSELLSAYLDGEVPSPWDERIKERLSGDPQEKMLYDSLFTAKKFLKDDKDSLEESLPEMKERVWSSIQKELETSPTPHRGFWYSRLSVPTPLVAAAALVLVFGFGFMMARGSMVSDETPLFVQSLPQDISPLGMPVANTLPDIQTLYSTQLNGFPLTPDQLNTLRYLADPTSSISRTNGVGVTINLQDINQLLQLLQGTSNIREISIELPGMNSLELIGEPALMPGRSRSTNEGDPGSQ